MKRQFELGSFPSKRQRTRPKQWGTFQAMGRVTIFTFCEDDMKGIAWENLRILFRPTLTHLHTLRIKPAITTRYGGELKVFAIPPAPEQWNNKIAELTGNMETTVEIKVFLEDIQQRSEFPYASLSYIWNKKEVIPHLLFAGSPIEKQQILMYLLCTLLLIHDLTRK